MSPSQPVIVLVHGAWADASSWTSAFTEPSGPPAWKTIPSWAVIGTGDRVIPPAELTFMAQRAGAHITDVNAGHLSLISRANVVTRVILDAVQATG
jgi:pimeloyl-ACP methyl ester carboxylesterase